MKFALLALTVFACVFAAGCRDRDGSTAEEPPSATRDGAQDIEPGVHPLSLAVRGGQRGYRLYVPRSLPASGRSLVIAMHGGLGTPDQFARNSRFDEEAEQHGFVVVYPEGANRTWNGGRCCGMSVRQNVDDVGFISALIDHLVETLSIDPKRVFATGHSNGGIMAFRLACELGSKIAAIAPVAGSLETDTCAGGQPVAVLAIHGDADENHPLNGGEGANSIAGVAFYSLASSMEKLRLVNGCAASTSTQTTAGITTSTWSGCKAGGDTVQKVIAGAPHAWPGGDRSAAGPGAMPSTALNATDEVWAFFASHSRP